MNSLGGKRIGWAAPGMTCHFVSSMALGAGWIGARLSSFSDCGLFFLKSRGATGRISGDISRSLEPSHEH